MNLGAELLIDFAIFTAIEIERRAVCKAFRLSDKQRVTKGNRVYWRGQLPLKDGSFYEIAIAQSPDMGNIDAAVLANDMIHDWSPGALLLVGIAGAGSTDQKLGDLALGRDVYYHERGKETSAGSKLEPYMYRADARLWNRVTAIPDWKTKIPEPRPDGTNRRPKTHYGVIASGERVIADIAARDQITAGHRKTVAIEMEGHGVGAALWQSVDRVRGLVIRAICDLADASKNSQWQPYAAAVAAGFAKHFLLDQPLEPRNAPRKTATKRIQLTLAMEFAAFDANAERLLVHALAGFLDIRPEAIKVCSVEEGSVKLVIELPADAAERLLEAAETGVISLPGSFGGEIRVSTEPDGPTRAKRLIKAKVAREDATKKEQMVRVLTERLLQRPEDHVSFLLSEKDLEPAQMSALRKQIEGAKEKICETREFQESHTNTASLHNLPYPPLGDLFTGRQEELDALASSGTAAITQSAAISGLGGIGKTRLAVEYAWRSSNRYTAKWFVRADSPENFRRNLAALAGPELMNLPERKTGTEEETFAAVKRWLRERPGWMMILDNVDTPEAADAALEVLPSLSTGHVLITSRLTTWPAGVRKQSLDKLSPEEAVRFLLHRTEGGRELAADDAARATGLVERVDGLPLVLEQAAAYISYHRLRLSEYLHAWEQEREKLLQWYNPRVMQYPASVAVTWKQTFGRLSPTSAILLRLMAFLAPDPIPFEMLEQGFEYTQKAAELFYEESGAVADGKTIREAVADLADYSLITRLDGGMLVVHRMMQEVLRSQVPEEHRREWIEGTLRIVNEAAVEHPSDVRTWPVWNLLRPHVAEVVVRADEVGIVEPTSRLSTDLGALLWTKSLYSEAEPWMRRALNIDEATFGKEHPRVAIDINNLALLLQETNRLEEAEPLLRRALDIDKGHLGDKHPNVARDLNNLASLLQATNRLEEAETLMRWALNIDEEFFGQEHPNVARDLSNLAGLLYTTNYLEEAEPLMRRALIIDEASSGNKHPKVAIRLNNLARLLQAANRLGEAQPLMRRAVEICEQSLGPEHPRTQAARKNLEILLAKMEPAAHIPSEEFSMKDFFISFNSADRSWADWIAWVLEEAKYSVVYQPWDFRPGGNFVLEMQKASSEAQKTVIVLSDHYLNADYTQPEWAAAFVDDPRGEKRKLIPFRVEKCLPTGLLKPLIYADLVGLTPEKAKEAVLSAVSDARPKPSQEPGFPGKATTPGHPAPVAFPGTPAPAPPAATAPAPKLTNRALAIWQEKLDFLREQEAIAADAAQRFAIKKQIEEAEEKIRELTR